MRLSEIVIERRDVETSGGAISVRGLSLQDIITLYREHEPDVLDLYKSFTGVDVVNNLQNGVEEFLFGVIDRMPHVAARVIAMATGEDTKEQTRIALTLPISVTMALLVNIAEMTFKSEDDVKKTAAVVMKAIKTSIHLLQKQ